MLDDKLSLYMYIKFIGLKNTLILHSYFKKIISLIKG